MEYAIDTMKLDDWPYVRSIYLEGIAGGHSTFEVDVPDWGKWDSGHMPEPRLVARGHDLVLGWAALSPVSSRCVYSGVAELSIYVGAEYRCQGIGSALLAALIDASEEMGIWTLQGGIFPENGARASLLARCGRACWPGGERSCGI